MSGTDPKPQGSRKRPAPDANGAGKDPPQEEPSQLSDDHQQKPAKRLRILEMAKSRMSKWAARLFDPNRPRGVIEPPQTIPLNDEFLQAFGKREKAHDKAMGIEKLKVDNDLQSDNEDGDDDSKNNASNENDALSKKSKKSSATGHTVKLFNLKYTTTEQTLQQACEAYGTVLQCNLLMDKEASTDTQPINKGRALVTYENLKDAKACLEGMQTLDGRPVRVELAVAKSSANEASAASTSRYFVGKDISKKCFRCGEPGHMAADCKNEPLPKPCPLCAMTDHEMRACPLKAVCFNCGIPGHVSRNCTQPRGLAPRSICSICYSPGHTKYQCLPDYTTATVAAQYAICLVCGQMGHLMCKKMKWTGRLQGVYCSNCGESGHVGKQCRRPRLEDCSRDESLANREIQRAETTIQSPPGARGPMARGRTMNGNNNGDRRRAKSAPPPRGPPSRQNSMPDRYDAAPPRYRGMPPRHDRHQQQQQQSKPPQNSVHQTQTWNNSSNGNNGDPLPLRDSYHYTAGGSKPPRRGRWKR